MIPIDPKSLNILIVDDTLENLKILTAILSRQGYQVRPAINGELALNAVKKKQPNLILLDIRMPGMDGYEVCRYLKKDQLTLDIPVIFISVLDEAMDKVKAFESGGVDYITKPFHPEEVLARVKTHLSLRQMQVELTEANKALVDSEDKFHSLSDASFEGIVFSEKDIILEANDTFCRMLGYQPIELIDKEASDFVSPEERENVKSKILSGYEQPYEIRCLRKDGSTFPIEAQSKMFSYKGKQVRVTAIRDLTEQKKFEEEISNLRGIIPICMHCKEVRNDKGYWNRLDQYISEHSEIQFSHGICDNCLKEHYPEDAD